MSKVEPKTGTNAFEYSEKEKAKGLVAKIREFIQNIPQDQKPNVICLFIGSNRQNQQIDEDNATKHTLLIQYLRKMWEGKKDMKKRIDSGAFIIKEKSQFKEYLKEFQKTPKDMRRSILMYPLLDKIADVLTKQLGEECNVTFQFEKGSLGDLGEPITDTTFSKSLNKFDWNKYGLGFKQQNITPEAAENIKKFINMYNVSRLLNLKRESQKELHFNFIDDFKYYVDEFEKMANDKQFIKSFKQPNVNLHLSGTHFEAFSGKD